MGEVLSAIDRPLEDDGTTQRPFDFEQLCVSLLGLPNLGKDVWRWGCEKVYWQLQHPRLDDHLRYGKEAATLKQRFEGAVEVGFDHLLGWQQKRLKDRIAALLG